MRGPQCHGFLGSQPGSQPPKKHHCLCHLPVATGMFNCQTASAPASTAGSNRGLMGDSCLPLSIWVAERAICQEELWMRSLYQFTVSDITNNNVC